LIFYSSDLSIAFTSTLGKEATANTEFSPLPQTAHLSANPGEGMGRIMGVVPLIEAIRA
jgi:hypothetical protein